MRRSAPAQLLALAAGAFFGGLGCEQILNVDGIKLGRQPALVDASADTVDAPPQVCVGGQLRCQGVALQVCLSDGSAFRTARVCSTPELCCDGPQCGTIQGCLPPACAAGDFLCEGTTLSICNDGQTGWTPIDECATAAQCNASLGRCTEQPCDSVRREYQCNGAVLEQCQAPGWRLIDTCATPTLCKTGAATVECAETRCVIGDNQLSPFQCTYGDLMRCNDAQTGFEHVETCLNPTRCTPLIEDLAGDAYAPVLSSQELLALGCRAANCSPGRYECQPDGALMRCNADLTGYRDLVDTCASAAHCNAAAGRCDAVPCTEMTTQCSGEEFQRCIAGRWVRAGLPCASGARCDHTQGCTPAVCQATEYRCEGRELMRCNVNLDGWIPVHTCETESLCNAAAKRCDQPVCLQGQRRCSRDGDLLECGEGREAWRIVADCGAGIGAGIGANVSAACDPTGPGRCLGQTSCAAGALRCNGQFIERCRDNTWVPHARCATAALCDASGTGSCLEPTCQPDTYQCVAPGANSIPAAPGAPTRGLLLQRCNSSGTGYELSETCSAEEFCDAAHGQCDICDSGEPVFCNGNELSVCTADGQERMLQRVCPLGCVTPEQPGPPACREDAQGIAPANPTQAPRGGS
jgi:hypothetical protein